MTIERAFVIENELGLHARPATVFVKTAARFSAKVIVEKDGRRINGKSIMELLTLAAMQGEEILIITEGDDAEDALAALTALFENEFS
jgi:phosphotransferase system HPr (HPr) family protein